MTGSLRNALLIHNPSAGNGGNARRRTLEQACRVLAAGGIEADLAETSGPGDATALARRAAEDRRRLVIVCGGDGTLNEAVNGLAAPQNGFRVPLALLPGGTANVLAKELGLPRDLPSAAAGLLHARVKDVALGLATPLGQPEKSRYFLSVAGAGPDGMIVYSVNLSLKARLGTLAYWWQGAREVLRYDFRRFRVVTAEKSIDTSLVVIGRTKHYGGPFKITTQADLFGDQFEILALETQSRLRYLSYLPSLWLNRLRGTPGIHFWKTSSVTCEPLSAPVHAQIDGEPFFRLPVEFKIVPRALQLFVPPPRHR